MAKTQPEGPVRVRFAPSPTGYLHVGGARTAIYNDLLRATLGGAFILRIEDTDRERSDEAMTRRIVDGLRWIGAHWDEGPFLQSDGSERHRAEALRLVEGGRAYRCFCTPDALAAARAEAEAKKERFRYPGTCRRLAADESARRAEAGEEFVVRLAMPDRPIEIDDLVRGTVSFPPEMVDDFVLLRSDGSPTYHLSVCCDDAEMEVTHVVRGDDHLSNTPKHVALFEALGAPVPRFGHLPLILGPDKKRLSKRTGATSVEEFRQQGILPQALYNYLALLGWSPGDDRELMSREEIVELFTVERLNASAAVFDRDKLAWMNAQYLMSLPLAEIRPHLEPFLDEQGIGDADRDRVEELVELHRQRAKTLDELAEQLVPYFLDRIDYAPELTAKYRDQDDLPDDLETLRDRYDALDDFAIDPLDRALRSLAEELEAKAAYLIHPLRMALTGSKAGPPVFDVVAAMGRDATRRHLDHFVEHLRQG